MPEDKPVTMPVAEPTVAAVNPPLHTPPVVASPNVTLAPAHRFVLPVIAAGDASTVIVLVTVQPEPREYVIIVAPGATPATTPPDGSIVPAAGLLLLQPPPGTASLNAVVAPWHTVADPMIPVGDTLTVTVLLVVHPVGKV